MLHFVQVMRQNTSQIVLKKVRMKKLLARVLLGTLIIIGSYSYLHKPNIPNVLISKSLDKFIPQAIPGKNIGIVRLDLGSGGHCTGSVINEQYIVTAAHCLHGEQNKDIKIIMNGGIDNNIVGHVVGYEGRTDLGLIRGEFKDFEPVTFNFTDAFFQLKPTRALACGYPLGQNKVVCHALILIANDFNNIFGQGYAVPGMSGGPVFDIDSKNAVAVMYGYSDKGPYIKVSPVEGLLGLFGLE